MDWTIRFRFGGIEGSLRYLESMAAKGWMLESWQGITLVFQRCEPRKLRFAMDVIPSTRLSLDDKTSNLVVREEYVQLYEEMGWHCVDNQENTFIFYTEEEEVPLSQTDPIAYKQTIYKDHRKNLFWKLIFTLVAVCGLWGERDALYEE